MRFVDEVEIEVQAGDGGNGCVAFRRETHMPLGGPSGGDGGKGGDVVFVTDSGLGTLNDLHFRRVIRAEPGEHGRGRDQYGKGGKPAELRLPVGTQVYDAETGALLVDLDEVNTRYVIAKGGRGGRGNMHFATPHDRAPRRAEDGRPGEHRSLRLELKLLADVGVIGFPNVGKSTFIAAVSRAKPKIADYPFTTLTPNLGVASLGPDRSMVIADIPGIIEGAAEGAGLGFRFLKHIERTRVLLHVLSPDPDPDRDPIRDFDKLMVELARFDAELAARPMVVVLGKADLPESRAALAAVRADMNSRGHEVLSMSSATREGLETVLLALEKLLLENPLPGAPSADRPLTASDRPADHPSRGHLPDPESDR
jgi:GTP-binding protein